MRKTIAEMMARGMSLEDIHKQMEEIFNEEYKKREQEQKAMEVAAARDRAARATIDYLSLVAEDFVDDALTVEEVGMMLDEAIETVLAEIDASKAPNTSKKVAATANDEDEAIRKFLIGLGFQPME